MSRCWDNQNKFISSNRSSDRSRGIILVFTAVIIVALIGIAGIALDVGFAYRLKGILQASSDLGALAGTRHIPEGILPDKDIKDRARQIVLANLHLQGFSPTLIKETEAALNASIVGVRDGVAVNVSIPSPLFLLKVLGVSNNIFKLNINSKANTRSIAMMVVIDRSYSMNFCINNSMGTDWGCSAYPDYTRINAAKIAANFLVGQLKHGDQVGLVSFSSEPVNATVEYQLTPPLTSADINFHKTNLINQINSLTPDNATHTWKGIRTGTTELLNGMTNHGTISQTNRGRVMLLLTDGAPADVTTATPIPPSEYTYCEANSMDPRMQTNNIPVNSWPGLIPPNANPAIGINNNADYFKSRLVLYTRSLNEAIKAQMIGISINVVGIGTVAPYFDHGPLYPRPLRGPYPSQPDGPITIHDFPRGLYEEAQSQTVGRNPAQDFENITDARPIFMAELANDQSRINNPEFLPLTLAPGDSKEGFWEFPCMVINPGTPSNPGTEQVITDADRAGHEWGRYVFAENVPELVDAFAAIIRTHRVRLVW